MEPLNDEILTLIENAQEGKNAFERLVRCYQHDVFRLIRVYTPNDSDAEDIAQETWIKVYRSLGKLKNPYRFPSWLKTIAVNTAKDWLKSRVYKKSQAIDEISPRQLWGPAVLQYQRQQLIEEVRDAIDSLSWKNREVVHDFYILGYSANQISQRLQLPLSTVTSRLQEARKQLRKEFSTMVAQSGIPEKFAPDTLVRNVMDKVGSLPAPVPTGNIIQRIGRLLPKEHLPKIGIATLIALTVIFISINLSNFKPSGNENQKGNPTFVAGAWRKRADMPTPRGDLSTSAVNGKIYAIGGWEGTNIFSANVSPTVEEYDAATDTWTRKADMPTPRVVVSTSVVNGKIYAIGGYTNEGGQPAALPTVEEYDATQNRWTKKADMPTPRWGLSTSMVNGKIYAIGGIASWPHGPVLSAVEEYDPVTDTWTKKADMPTPRWSLFAGVVNGKIYAIGGGRPTSSVPVSAEAFPTVEEYDAAQDRWTKKTSMPTPRVAFSTSVVNEKIYAIGGTPDIHVTLPTVEVYNPATHTWAKESDLPAPRGGHASSVVNGKIYVIGGASDNVTVILPTVEEYDPGLR